MSHAPQWFWLVERSWHPPPQDLKRRVSWAVVIGEGMPADERDQRLTQYVPGTAEDRVGTAPAGRLVGDPQMLLSECGQ